MKNRKPLVFLITTIFCISNTFAAGTTSTTQTITTAVKESKISESATLLDWVHSKNLSLHEKVKDRLTEIALQNPNFKIPKIEISSYKNAGIDYTRVILKDKKESIVIDVREKDGKFIYKINGHDKTFEDMYYSDFLDNDNLNPQLSVKNLDKVYQANPKTAAYYQNKMRDLLNSVTEVKELSQIGVPKQVSYIDFILSTAYASYADGTCIVAGNMTKFDQRAPPKDKNICGLSDKSVQGSCLAGQFSCNPLIYGFTDAGAASCVPREKSLPAVYVSDKCNQLHNLEGDSDGKKGEAFVASVLKNKDKLNLKTEEDFYTQLTAQIASAGKSCDPEFDQVKFMDKVKSRIVTKYEEKNFLKGFPPVMVNDKNNRGKQIDLAQGHRTACAFMMNRLVLAKKASACAELHKLAADSPEKADREILGKSCGEAVEVAAVVPNAAAQALPPPPPPAKDDGKDKCAELSGLIAKEKSEGINEAEQGKLKEEGALSKCGLARVVPTAPPAAAVVKEEHWCKQSGLKTFACALPFIVGGMCLLHIFICPKKENTTAALPVGKPGEPSNPRTRAASGSGDLINRIFKGSGRE